ncbi:hypothetical protein BRC81_09820 [Halobacteriales archaeon QS_1_68_20]|nr:MAG: hypothetical protein BRC81_09820 [Halobacteriales archaeon QS_1_68_20]
MNLDRRDLLRAAGAGSVVGLGGLSGCAESTGSECPTLPAEPDYRGWLDGVSNYDGTCDFRDREAVTVDVGVRGGLGYFKYGPAAVHGMQREYVRRQSESLVGGTFADWLGGD